MKMMRRFRRLAKKALVIFAVCKSSDGFQTSLLRRQQRPTSACDRKYQTLKMSPDAFHFASETMSKAVALNPLADFHFPFQETGNILRQELDRSMNFGMAGGEIPEEATRMVLGSLGEDILVFLTASVLVTTICNAIGVTPILGYLIIGAILGSNGLNIFANQQAGVELGDFGILFLLFSEGLDVTSARLQKLANYLPLGAAQISLTTGVLTALLLFLGHASPSEIGFLNINDPILAAVLAITCTLSTSAFIFPVLKEKGWEDERSGEAATTILLLQDLLVAPLLVLLPYLVGTGPTDYTAIGFLTAKATLGFGSVIVAGSFLLRGLFRLVSQTRSSEIFVALCLLVAAGMGEIAKSLGLTDTAGAFAAGVLLANTNYRSQIQADILPFKGILLGIFFMDAGSNFDLKLVFQEWQTVLIGSLILLGVKALTLAAATRIPPRFEPNRLPKADALRVSILLSGGGEFAFVVLALAGKLEIVDQYCIRMMTAIVLVTMGVTPLLGDLATTLSDPLVEAEENSQKVVTAANPIPVVSYNAIVVCGHAEAGRAVMRVLGDRQAANHQLVDGDAPRIVAFSRNPGLVNSVLRPGTGTVVLYGDGNNPEVIRSSGVTNPRAIFVTYEEHNRALSATARLRAAFPDTPIYARAAFRREARNLQLAGATEAVVECDELAKSVPLLMRGEYDAIDDDGYDVKEDFRVAASAAARIPFSVVDELFELYDSLDMDATGLLDRGELIELFRKTKKGFIASDKEIKEMEYWLETTTSAHMDPMDRIEFCRLYGRAPEFVKQSFGIIRQAKG